MKPSALPAYNMNHFPGLFSLQDWEDTPKSQKVERDATAPWIHCHVRDLFILKQHLNEKRIMCVVGMCIFLTIWILRVNLLYVSQVENLIKCQTALLAYLPTHYP